MNIRAVNKVMVNGNNFVNNVEDYGIKLVANRIKRQFGFETFIKENMFNKDENNKVLEFFKKYVKNFESEYILKSGELRDNFLNIVKLDKGTFMYIANGIYIPDGYTQLLVENNRGGNENDYVYVYLFGKKSPKYKIELDKCIDIEAKKHLNGSIYIVNEVNRESTDISLMTLTDRSIDSLIFSFGESEAICKHIDNFISNIDFYKSKQINYKTGILLYGIPGTGKSSLVKAIASKYNRSICQINVGNLDKIVLSDVTAMINAEETEKYIVLLEDIDTLTLKREDIQKNGGSYEDILNGLMQFLDSNISPDNVIFVATTNHIERLDEAMLRAGRFDLKVEVKPIVEKDIERFTKTLEYKGSVSEIVKEYGEAIHMDNMDLYNQSKLQNVIITKKGYKLENEIEE